MFAPAAFESHTELSNAQRVSASTTTILPTIAGNYHDLNCLGHGMYVPYTRYPGSIICDEGQTSSAHIVVVSGRGSFK